MGYRVKVDEWVSQEEEKRRRGAAQCGFDKSCCTPTPRSTHGPSLSGPKGGPKKTPGAMGFGGGDVLGVRGWSPLQLTV